MAKKKQAKKMKSKKLEDRIAPGMVGGGLIDPGMVEAVEVDSAQDGVEDDMAQTQSESFQNDSGAEQAQYLDDSSGSEVESETGPNDNLESEQHEEFSSEQYDEFSQGDTTGEGEFVEESGGWQEPDWVSANADGSIDITPPEGVTIDADAGIANFPVDLANTELPLPDDVQITPEGGLEMPLPEGAEYLQESNQLLVPQDQINLDEVPEGMDAYNTPDGNVMITLPDDGVSVDPEAGTIQFDNYHANEFTPDNMEIQNDGSVNIQFPEDGVEFNDDGSIHLEAQASQFMDNPPPEVYSDMDYAEYQADGSVTIAPPEGVIVDGGIAEMEWDTANEQLEMHEDFQLNDDGTSQFNLPEGAEFNEAINGITFPEGEINLDEVPEGVDAHLNPDGTATVMLTEGMNYDLDSNSVQLDNHMTNEITPDNMNFDQDGVVNIALPEGTEFYEDGSFNIPADQIDFMEVDQPDYVSDCEWAEGNIDNGYNCQPPEGIQVDSDQGQLLCEHEHIGEAIPHPDEVTFHSDGTMSVGVPEGTEFLDGQLNFPEGSVQIDEFPEQINPTLNPDGSITVSLQDGMSFDGETNSVTLDNYWTNELTPEPVEYTQDGQMIVDLPVDCEFHDDGSFTIPEGSTDFIENPDPAYCNNGPDWVETNPDGSVTMQNSEHFESNPEQGQVSMNAEYLNEGFEDYKPDDLEFHDDGTMTAQTPDGTLFDAQAGSLTFPEGSMHLDEIPEGVDAQINDNGSISITLQTGMDFNPENGTVHFDNYWTNELTPDCAEFSPDGQCSVDMPHDSHFHEDGSVTIPEGSCDFVENPNPEYVDNGPEWVADNPDGSVTITAPEGMEVNAQEGYISMDYEMANEQLGGDLIPEEMTLNADGTIDVQIPTDIQFDFNEQTNSFTLTETPENFNINEVPEFLEASFDDAGNVHISLPEGVEYNESTGTLNLSNEIVNEIAPEPILVTPQGEFQINLPDDTQYFDDGFVISSESADFLEDQPEDEYYQAQQQAS